MRALSGVINQIRYASSNHLIMASVLTLAVGMFAFLGINGIQSAKATSNDIVQGGVWNRGDLNAKGGGDVRTIMNHYRIDMNLAGTVDGRVCKDGNVYVGDRVVARNSTSIGRNPINGSRPIAIGGVRYYETHNSQALVPQCLDTFVKLDGNGSFVYAIIKACGNPIWTPEPVVVNPPAPEPPKPTPEPPKPEPQPEPAYECNYLTADMVSRNKVRLSHRATAINGAEIVGYEYNYGDGNTGTSRTHTYAEAGTYTITVNVKIKVNGEVKTVSGPDCEAEVTVEKEKVEVIEVCDIKTGNIVTISQEKFKKNQNRYASVDSERCKDKLVVCVITGADRGQIKSITEDQFDASKHSKNQKDCEEKPVPATPVALPKTGPGGMIFSGIGLAGIILAGSVYLNSRRDLLSAFLNR